MYSKQELLSLIQVNPALRKTFSTSLNSENENVVPSLLHPDPPTIGTTWCNDRYVLVDINHTNRSTAASYFFDSFGSIRAHDPKYTDQLFIQDLQNKVDSEGSPIIYELPFGWSGKDIDTLNQEFFQRPNILKTLNDLFIKQVNQIRAEHSLNPLELDESLHEGSMTRTKESCEDEFVHPEHIRPNGDCFYTAFDKTHDEPRYSIGENQIAVPYNGNVYTLLNPALITLAVENWRNSPSHLDNFLYSPYTKAYITVQVNKRSSWLHDELAAYFTPSIFLTCHFSTH